jgi:hypothetical protein
VVVVVVRRGTHAVVDVVDVGFTVVVGLVVLVVAPAVVDVVDVVKTMPVCGGSVACWTALPSRST